MDRLQQLLAADGVEPTVFVGAILMGLARLLVYLFEKGRLPSKAQSFLRSPRSECGLGADFETQREQLVAVCETLRDAFQQKLDEMKLHAEFGKLPGEFTNFKTELGRIAETFTKLDGVSDRLQGVSARMKGLMNELGKLQDLMEDRLLRNVQDR